jgi:hypothetical protein
MRINTAGWDRALRILLGVTLLILGWGGFVTGTIGLVLKIGGFIPLLTGITGVCPAYIPFNFSTKRV